MQNAAQTLKKISLPHIKIGLIIFLFQQRAVHYLRTKTICGPISILKLHCSTTTPSRNKQGEGWLKSEVT